MKNGGRYYCNAKKYFVKTVKKRIVWSFSLKKISLLAKNNRYLQSILKTNRLINF